LFRPIFSGKTLPSRFGATGGKGLKGKNFIGIRNQKNFGKFGKKSLIFWKVVEVLHEFFPDSEAVISIPEIFPVFQGRKGIWFWGNLLVKKNISKIPRRLKVDFLAASINWTALSLDFQRFAIY